MPSAYRKHTLIRYPCPFARAYGASGIETLA